MLKLLTSILFFFIFTHSSVSYCQNKDSVYTGSAIGTLRDTARNIGLPNATVSVYRFSNNVLVTYQLTDNLGRFTFKQLPKALELRLIVNAEGYESIIKEFKISPSSGLINLGTIVMHRKAVELAEVVVEAQPPPIRMKGDTLEFNAAAFKLDSNAVLGDMLRKLPGVTVWNDGVITVNGKKIKKLLVEGKDFFGNGSRIALENLAKNAIQKVQVYDDKASADPAVPETAMNIVLKKSKKDGYFGKISSGIGNDKRHDLNGMLNFFNSKLQVSVLGASNNVNKSAKEISTLIQLNSFKGEGLNNDYFTDFSQTGQNSFKAIGFTLQYDLLANKANEYKKEQFKADYFLRNTTNDIRQQLQTLISFDGRDQIKQSSAATIYKNSINHVSNVNYSKTTDHSTTEAKLSFQNNRLENKIDQSNTSIDLDGSGQSHSNNKQAYSADQNLTNGSFKYTSQRYTDPESNQNKSINLEIGYNLNLNKLDESDNRSVNFFSSDTAQNKVVNRKYFKSSKLYEHILITNVNDVLSLIDNKASYISTSFRNALSVNSITRNNDVSDLRNGFSYFNSALTGKYVTNSTDEKPGINFSKTFSRVLSNRYSKIWNINIFAQAEAFNQQTTSNKDYQNLQRSYFYFIPSASIAYTDFKYGGSRKGYVLNANTSVEFPTIEQLAPIVDDIDPYFINYGNSNLKPSYKRQASFSFNYDNGIAKAPLFIEAEIALGIVKSFIGDSVYYDNNGRSIHFPINVSEKKYMGLSGMIKKAYKINSNELIFSGSGNLNYSESPTSVNGIFTKSQISNYRVFSDVTYGYNDLFKVDIGQSYSSATTVQQNLNKYAYHNLQNSLGLIFKIRKRLAIGSKIDFNYASSSSSTNKVQYTIWNADLTYRFLRGENGEIKFLALDILHQNKNIINYVGNNSITFGTVNVLQQYFMISLAYYPRQFGIGKHK